VTSVPPKIEISTVFCDVGGVLLTDGWGHDSRKLAARHFNFEYEEFEKRHEPLAKDLDCGLINVLDYLNQTLFYRPRAFNQSEFMEFMRAQSEPFSDRIQVIAEIAESKKYLMATINNESLELNAYRINKFELYKYFSLFFSSCYMRSSKPEAPIFDNALCITQKAARECVFIDDREANLVVPKQLGMRTILCTEAGQLRKELMDLGVFTQRPPHLV
jgi:putative hydrolase of the HAD superfamily